MKKRRAFELAAVLYKMFSSETESEKFRKHYSDTSFGSKVKRIAKTAGMKVVYPALLLQYLMKSEEVSLKTKLIISAALGYFILPVDFIPDFAPLIGFADDVGVMVLLLRQVATNVTPDIKMKARQHLQKWFGETDEAQLDDLELEFESPK